MAWEYGDYPVAIDPDNCGCTECLIGMYAQQGSHRAQEAFEALVDGRISSLRSNANCSFMAWRGRDGEMHVEEFTTSTDDYTITELPHWSEPVLITKDINGDPQIRVLPNCPGVDAVKFVLDSWS